MLEFIRLAEVIRQHSRGELVYLLHNTGNWGDALIRFGTERFLESFAIPYQRLLLDGSLPSRLALRRASLSRSVLLCMGSGSWCGHYNHFSRTVERICRRSLFRQLIVLPSTYDRPFELPRTIFFRRDQVGSAETMPDSIFCHDLAFFIGSLRGPAPSQERLYCFRLDTETSGANTLTTDNRDLSAEGTESDDVFPFLEILSGYRQVYTDRLHAAIGSALLGREVHLYPGKYFKNHSIYVSSLQPHYPNVTWHAKGFAGSA